MDRLRWRTDMDYKELLEQQEWDSIVSGGEKNGGVH